MDFKIQYGLDECKIDVTDVCFKQLMVGSILHIPAGDGERSRIFSDPLIGVLKKVYIVADGKTIVCENIYEMQINMVTGQIVTRCVDENYRVQQRISKIHSDLKINYGNLMEELPEQKMVARYLTGNEKVLEIGGNIGRNSLVIAHILNAVQGTCSNFVSLESDSDIAVQLTSNRELNNFNFHIENSALSKRKLMQKGWDTVVSDVLEPDYKWINTITLDELNAKYQIVFDTLVLDCEGAFYYILMDMPEILDNIKLIIMENDYHTIEKKQYIDSVMSNKGFVRDYVEPGGWGPCVYNFFEVWVRT